MGETRFHRVIHIIIYIPPPLFFLARAAKQKYQVLTTHLHEGKYQVLITHFARREISSAYHTLARRAIRSKGVLPGESPPQQ